MCHLLRLGRSHSPGTTAQWRRAHSRLPPCMASSLAMLLATAVLLNTPSSHASSWDAFSRTSRGLDDDDHDDVPLDPNDPNLQNSRDDDDDLELECPFELSGFVGTNDPDPCNTLTCWAGNAYIHMNKRPEMDPCSIDTLCCPIILGYCALQPDDVECKTGSHHMKLFSDECPFNPAKQLGCPHPTTTATATKTTTTTKIFTVTTTTTTTHTTYATRTSTTYTATTRTITSTLPTTTTTTTTTRCLGGEVKDPLTGFSTTYWKCFSGNQCVVQRFTCDGYPDCADGSDELYCGCTDGSCTPASTTTVTTSTTTRTTATTSTRSSTTVTTSTVTTSTETSTTRSRTTTTLSTTTTTATETTRTISMITTFKPVAATTTTKTEYHPDNVDCVEEQDSCTEACERKDQRNYKLLVPQRRSGKACQGPTDCGMYYKDFGTGTLFSRRCTPPPTTTTTTTLTTVTAIPKVALGLAEEGSVNSTAVEADVGARTKPGMVVLYLVIVMLFVLVLYFVLQEMGYIPANFWTNIHAWFLAKWAALILCCCSSSSSPPKDDPDDKAPSSEVAETEFDLLSKGLMKNRRKDDAAAMAAAAAAPKSKFARDSDEDTSDEEGVEDFGPPKPDLQAAQLAAPLLDGESSEDEEVALVRHRKSGVLLGGVTQEGTTDQGSTVLYSDAGSGGRFIIPVGGEEAKPGQVLLGGVTTEGTRDDGQTVLYDSASATVSSIPTKKQHVIETSTVDYVIPMMTSAATGAGKKRVRQKSWVEDVNDVDTDLPSLPAKAADATDNSAEEFYDLATVAAPGSRVGDQSSGIADTIYSTAASGNTGAADTSIYLEPGQSVNFGATTPPDEELYSLAAGGSALHVQGGGAGQFLIPMAEDDGGAGAAQEEAIYSAALEAPPGEALYDAASPGGPPPPLPQKSSSAVNPEPTYPTPSPGEELYSLASGGSALHVQGGGAGQFLIPMAEDDGGAGAAQEETIYSAVLEAPPGEELYSLASGGAALHVQGGGAGQFIIPMAEDDGGAGAAQEEAIYSAALEAPPGEALYDAASPGDPTAFRAQATTGANFMIPMDPTIDAAPPTLPQKSSAGDGAEK